MADRVGADLTGEVDLERRVDGDNPIDLADQIRVVRAVAGMKLDERVVVDVVVQSAAAYDKTRDRPAWMDRLLRVGHRPRLDQSHDAVGKHLGMDAKITPPMEELEHRIRNAADPELQTGPVLHECGDVLADPAIDLGRRQRVVLRQVAIGRRPGRQPVERHARVAVRSRHAGVDLGEHDPRGVDRGACRVDARPE